VGIRRKASGRAVHRGTIGGRGHRVGHLENVTDKDVGHETASSNSHNKMLLKCSLERSFRHEFAAKGTEKFFKMPVRHPPAAQGPAGEGT
jgi:hypothetical protein